MVEIKGSLRSGVHYTGTGTELHPMEDRRRVSGVEEDSDSEIGTNILCDRNQWSTGGTKGRCGRSQGGLRLMTEGLDEMSLALSGEWSGEH